MKGFAVILCMLITPNLVSQNAYELTFSSSDYKLIKKNPEKIFKDSIAALKYLKDLRNFAIKKGHLLASLDSFSYSKNKLLVSFFVGQKFSKARISLQADQVKKLNRISGVTERFLADFSFQPSEIERLMTRIVRDFENNGYPFVQVRFVNIQLEEDVLKADLEVHEGMRLKWTEIHLKGEELLSKRMISSYIQINEGDFFSQENVRLISARLKQISFVEEIKPAELLFTEKGVELFLYLKSKPVSLANGVIGLQPNPQTQVLTLTGDVRLKLVNTLKKAEMLDINWRSIQPQTQALKAQIVAPNLLRSPFGLDGQFHLYKRDSTFLEVKATAAVQYSLGNGNFLKAFYRNQTSSVLTGGKNNPAFSNLGNVKTNFYGLGLSRQAVDYLPNPRKGFLVQSDLAIGSRKSQKTDTSSIITQTTYKGELAIQWFVPLAKRHVLRFANQTEFYIAPEIFQNEVFRFGGQLTQRGFNEEELFATTRTIFSLEYRFLLDRNSFVFAFFDQSWYENNAVSYYNDQPFGFGAGFSFGTNIGTFSISYALGSQQGNPILFRDGKVHFGYVAFF
jgi:outer membrane protein assembly factor BamA